MKHLLVVLLGAASEVRSKAPAWWTDLCSRGVHGDVLLVPEGTGQGDDGSEVLAILGYRPEQPGGDLGACDAVGRGAMVTTGLTLEPFLKRTRLTGAWISERVRSRGVAGALGLTIFEPRADLEGVFKVLERHELVCIELLPPWGDDTLEQSGRDLLVPLAQELSSRGGLRILVLATGARGEDSLYAMEGAGIWPAPLQQPRVPRGEELLPGFLESFHV